MTVPSVVSICPANHTGQFLCSWSQATMGCLACPVRQKHSTMTEQHTSIPLEKSDFISAIAVVVCIVQYTVFLPLLHNNGHHRWVGIPLGSNTWIKIRFYYSSIPNSLFHFQKVVHHINIIDGTLDRTMRAWSVKDAYIESQWFTGQTVTGVGYWFLSDLGCEKGDRVCMCEWENKGEREQWQSVKEKEGESVQDSEREREMERERGWGVRARCMKPGPDVFYLMTCGEQACMRGNERSLFLQYSLHYGLSSGDSFQLFVMLYHSILTVKSMMMTPSTPKLWAASLLPLRNASCITNHCLQ